MVRDAVQIAFEHQQAGRYAEAERIYKRVLKDNPKNARVLHLLGTCAIQAGDLAAAIDHIRKAIRIDANQASFHANLAEVYRVQNRLDEAQTCYRRAVELDPRMAQAQNYLGMTLQVQGKLADALACFQAAIAAQPNFAAAQVNLGYALQLSGRLQDAIAAFSRAVAVDANYAQAYYHLGNALRMAGRLEPAREALARAVSLADSVADVHFALGTVLQNLGQLDAAEREFRRALAIDPRHAVAHLCLGAVRQTQGKPEEAIDHYAQAVAIRPDFSEALHTWGAALAELRRDEEAVQKYRQAIAARPTFVDSHYNLGTVLQRLKRYDEAAPAYEETVRLQPGYAMAHNNLGNVYFALGRREEAIASLRRALATIPQATAKIADLAGIYNNLGNALNQQGETQQALEHFQKALELLPSYPQAHHNLALWYLSHERFAEGWPEFAWRLKCPEVPTRDFPQPLWQGEDLAGRTLLVHAEQGMGDVLQMIRYLAGAQKRAGSVVVEVPPRLVPLLESSGFTGLVPAGTPLPHFDVQIPIMNLPCAFGTTLENMPRDVPYLVADPALVAAWREKLAKFSGLKVGLAWQGNRAYQHDRDRSIALAHFAPLAAVGGVQLLALQKHDGAEQIAQVAQRFAVHDLGRELDETTGAFMDTAAVMKNLDLVITSDSAIAHLAGALGVRTWLALAYVPEWRWFLARDDSPWYPTMRLFRQRSSGDWPEVFARMAAELQSIAACQSPQS